MCWYRTLPWWYEYAIVYFEWESSSKPLVMVTACLKYCYQSSRYMCFRNGWGMLPFLFSHVIVVDSDRRVRFFRLWLRGLYLKTTLNLGAAFSLCRDNHISFGLRLSAHITAAEDIKVAEHEWPASTFEQLSGYSQCQTETIKQMHSEFHWLMKSIVVGYFGGGGHRHVCVYYIEKISLYQTGLVDFN